MRISLWFSAALAATLAMPANAGLRFEPSAGPAGARVGALAPDGSTLWAATYRGVYKLAAGAWSLDGLGDRPVTGVAVSGGIVWAATGEALYRRAADGTWSLETLPVTTLGPTLLASDGDALVVGGPPLAAGGAVLARRSGGSWSALPSPGSGFPTLLASDPGGLLVGLSSGGVSRLFGGAFTAVGGLIGTSEPVQALVTYGNVLYAGTSRGVYSFLSGTWTADVPFGIHDVRALSVAGGTLRAATYDAGVLRLSGSGWSPDRSGVLTLRTTGFALLGSDLYLGTGGGPVYRYSGSSWTDAAPGTLAGAEVTAIEQTDGGSAPLVGALGAGVLGATLGDGCGDVLAIAPAPQGLGALLATSCGPLVGSGSFAPAANGLPAGSAVVSLAPATSGGVVGGTAGSGMWRFTGSSWSGDNDGLSDTAQVRTVRQVNGALLASVNGHVLARGASGAWSDVGQGLPPGSQVTSFAGGASSFAGLDFGGVYRRDGNGDWRPDSAGLLSHGVTALDDAGGLLTAAAGTGGVFVRSQGGFRPEIFGLPAGVDARVVRALPQGPGAQLTLFAGTVGRGTFRARAFPLQRIVPVVLDVAGLGGSHFRTELTIGTRIGRATRFALTFTPAPGFGAPAIPVGTASVVIPAGAELRVPDTLEWLRSLGMPIPATSTGTSIVGTLSFSAAAEGVSDSADNEHIYAIARTYTTGSGGTFGLFYDAPSDIDTAEESAAVYALRSVSGAARSNLALVHVPAGRGTDPVTLSVQVYGATGVPAGAPMTRTLAPGEWTQINGILGAAGLPDGSFGYAKITRVSGIGTWLAYGVVNDEATSDGSYLPMQRPGGLAAVRRQIVPVVLDVNGAAGSHYTTELTLVNDGPIGTPVDLTFEPAPGFGTVSGLPQISVNVPAHAQVTLADVLQAFRDKGVGVPRAENGGAAGSLSVDFRYLTNLEIGTTLALARTTTPNTDTATGGAFGLFYPAVAVGGGARTTAVVPALRQDSSARSNLAVVHVGGGSSIPLGLSVQLYDAQTGGAVGAPLRVTLQPGEWKQWASVITAAGAPSGVTSAYAVITRTSGDDTFFAYGVQNDAVTSDGSYVAMLPDEKL